MAAGSVRSAYARWLREAALLLAVVLVLAEPGPAAGQPPHRRPRRVLAAGRAELVIVDLSGGTRLFLEPASLAEVVGGRDGFGVRVRDGTVGVQVGEGVAHAPTLEGACARARVGPGLCVAHVRRTALGGLDRLLCIEGRLELPRDEALPEGTQVVSVTGSDMLRSPVSPTIWARWRAISEGLRREGSSAAPPAALRGAIDVTPAAGPGPGAFAAQRFETTTAPLAVVSSVGRTRLVTIRADASSESSWGIEGNVQGLAFARPGATPLDEGLLLEMGQVARGVTQVLLNRITTGHCAYCRTWIAPDQELVMAPSSVARIEGDLDARGEIVTAVRLAMVRGGGLLFGSGEPGPGRPATGLSLDAAGLRRREVRLLVARRSGSAPPGAAGAAGPARKLLPFLVRETGETWAPPERLASAAALAPETASRSLVERFSQEPDPSLPVFTVLGRLPQPKTDLGSWLSVHVAASTDWPALEITTLRAASADDQDLANRSWLYEAVGGGAEADESRTVLSCWVPPATIDESAPQAITGAIRLRKGAMNLMAGLEETDLRLSSVRQARHATAGGRPVRSWVVRNLGFLGVAVSLLLLVPFAASRVRAHLRRWRRRCAACQLIYDIYPLLSIEPSEPTTIVSDLIRLENVKTPQVRDAALEDLVARIRSARLSRTTSVSTGLAVWGLWCERCQEGLVVAEVMRGGEIVDEADHPVQTYQSKELFTRVTAS